MKKSNFIYKQCLEYGIKNCTEIIYNPSYNDLFKEEINFALEGLEKCTLTNSGALAVNSGKFTGRSPMDKYWVKDENTNNKIWWCENSSNYNDNHPIDIETWKYLKKIVCKQLSNKKIFVMDVFCGASKYSRIKVRFITEIAWQAHFVKNMFINLNNNEIDNFIPDFVVLNASKCINRDWKKQKLNSENFIVFNLSEKMQIIGGTWYNGEMKKGIFSVMNYKLPLNGIASMHCAANADKENKNVALFFGLSGTGKTTLSADSNRLLIGDDEHGWDDYGIFNLEGGCYAKTANLNYNSEPEIYKAIKKNALLENVAIDKHGNVDYSDTSKTENSRVSYPIYHINNIVRPESRSEHARFVIFLTADAYGVLPLVSKLSLEQAQYYFLSGFTAKLSGTEIGISKPVPTFSECFGKAFLSLHPIIYTEILFEKIKKCNAFSYLVNTGWDPYNRRISISKTRNIINSILSMDINKSSTYTIPVFNLSVPKKIFNKYDKEIDQRNMYDKQDKWIIKANKLADLFNKNFLKFSDTKIGKKLLAFGPKRISFN